MPECWQGFVLQIEMYSRNSRLELPSKIAEIIVKERSRKGELSRQVETENK